jgi:peptidoglycan/xylan/chitin deacetylase (PgdA/CDA1 family)
MLTSAELMIMQKGNIAFGAHTITHKVLSEIGRESVWQEINDSKSALERLLNEEVKYFAYPVGKKRDFTDDTMKMVEEAGYVAAFSTENGCINNKSNIFALNRLGMRDYPLFVFKVRVSGIFENRWLSVLRKIAGLT